MKIGRGGYYIDPSTLDRGKKDFASEDFHRDVCDLLDDFTPVTADTPSDDLADVLQSAKTEILWMRRAVSDLNAQVASFADENARLRDALRFYADPSDYKAPQTGGNGKLYFSTADSAHAPPWETTMSEWQPLPAPPKSEE